MSARDETQNTETTHATTAAAFTAPFSTSRRAFPANASACLKLQSNHLIFLRFFCLFLLTRECTRVID
jgi:hypothetical protein